MPYLICEKCGGYYELKRGESPHDFDQCQCGGNLEYYNDLPEFTNYHSDEDEKQTNYKEESDYELNLYQMIQQKENEQNNIRYEKNRDKFFSENFISNSGFIVLTFSIIPLFFGFTYSNWILYLITGTTILLSVAFLLLSNSTNPSRISYFQKMFIITGAILGLTTLSLLSLAGNSEFLQDLVPRYYNRGGYAFLYLSSLYFSAYFCYIFLKNSRMKKRIDLLNSMDITAIRFDYYYIIFVLYLVMIGSIIIAVLMKLSG